MRAVLLRVTRANVRVEGATIASISSGICCLVGVDRQDELQDAVWLAEKISRCRLFEDETGKMNRSLLEVKGELLAVSQFTLLGDLRRGNRPGFSNAMTPQQAVVLFNAFCENARNLGLSVQTGQFGADMAVESVNDGPVTLLLDSHKIF